jgi:protein-tyrosine kinase
MNLIEKAVARLEDVPVTRTSVQPPLHEKFEGIFPLNLGATTEADVIDQFRTAERPEPTARPQLPSREIVELPLARLAEQGFLTPEGRASALGREFRSIKSPLLEKAFGTEAQRVANGKRIVVTSSLPGEGKTFCAINLAISVAAAGDHPVLLIDADIVRPSIAAHLGIKTTTGLSDVLTGKERDPLKVVLQTSLPGLSVVPAGESMPHAGEFLAAQEMAWLLDRYSARFPDALIILDTPPVLAVTETRSLIQRVGQVIMVVAAGVTTRNCLDSALAKIKETSHVSMILNKVSEAKSNFGSYYD